MRCRKSSLSIRLLMLCGLLVIAGQTAIAQEGPKIELAGTYTMLPEFWGPTCHGAAGSVAYNLNNWFGVTGEISGCRGRGPSGLFFFGTPPSTTHKWFTYLAGPRISYRRTFTPYAHVLFGGAHTSIESSSDSASANTFAMTIGFGVDARLSERFAIRLIQPEYLRTHLGGGVRHDLRLQTGVVFTLKQ
jgi:hypothetical protein